MWAYIETHPEVVTNLLDLISLVLMTPQLLRLANVTAQVMSIFLGGAILFGVMSIVTFIGHALWSLPHTWGIYIIMLLLVVAVIAIPGLFLHKVANVIESFVSPHLFETGFGLFFTSRLLALAFAMYK